MKEVYSAALIASNSLEDESTAVQADDQRHPLPIRLPVTSRGFSIRVIAAVLTVAALREGKDFFVPLLIAVILSYSLNPLLVWLERHRVRRAFGTTFLMSALVGGLIMMGSALHGEASTIAEQLPRVTSKTSALLQGRNDDQPSMLQRVQTAAHDVDKARQDASNNGGEARAPSHVIVDNAANNMSDVIWEGSRGLLRFVAQATIVLFLMFFLLLSGDSFKRKLVKLTGPALSSKKVTVLILEDINASIQKYMLALLLTNTLLGIASWGAFSALGLQNAGAWAVVAGLFHIIPYVGPLATASLTGVAAFLQGGSISLAISVVGSSILIAAIVGILITTWMTGRITRMNPTAVFVCLLFWTFVWGIWGALLAVPITGIIKVVCQRIEQCRPFSVLLSD